MNTNSAAHLKKSWLISTMIARDLLLCDLGDRLPAIQEYADRFSSSRGIVQNALGQFEASGAVVLEKRGKHGTILRQSDQAALLAAAGLQYITASMAPPITDFFSGLATGICLSFEEGPPYFNFAFMHSSENRGKALNRMAYDFIIVSGYSAEILTRKYPDLSVAMLLEDSTYEPPLCLWTSREDAAGLSDGDSIAVDPNSNDQYDVTMRLCDGKKVRIQYEPYLTTRLSLVSGKVDFVVLRENELLPQFHQIPIELGQIALLSVPAVLVNRNHYGMDRILQRYLDFPSISRIQREVIEKRRAPEFY